MKLDDQHLLGITLYRTPEPVRIRALAAAVHGRNRALASDLLIAARDLERQVPPTIIVIEQEGARNGLSVARLPDELHAVRRSNAHTEAPGGAVAQPARE